MSWKDDFGVWSLRGRGAVLGSERAVESGEAGRASPSPTGAWGVSQSGLSMGTGPLGPQHVFGLHLQTHFGKLIRLILPWSGRTSSPTLLFVTPLPAPLIISAEASGFGQYHLKTATLHSISSCAPACAGHRETKEAPSSSAYSR